MQKIRLTDLDGDTRAFLANALKGNGVIIEDDKGRAYGGVIPYSESTAAERTRAWHDIEDIDETVTSSIHEHRVGEDDLVRRILEDD
jgi:hypothetical protein